MDHAVLNSIKVEKAFLKLDSTATGQVCHQPTRGSQFSIECNLPSFQASLPAATIVGMKCTLQWPEQTALFSGEKLHQETFKIHSQFRNLLQQESFSVSP